MGNRTLSSCAALTAIFLLAIVAGCQMSTVPAARLVAQRQLVDERGLCGPMAVPDVSVTASLPLGWIELKTQKTLLYTHQQWRSPTKRTAVGVTHARLLMPVGMPVIEWMVMGEVNKRSKDGKVIRDWRDDLGRHWFEVENTDFHITGYLMIRGCDVWVNYWGYRAREPIEPADIKLASQSLDSVLPDSVQMSGAGVAAK